MHCRILAGNYERKMFHDKRPDEDLNAKATVSVKINKK